MTHEAWGRVLIGIGGVFLFGGVLIYFFGDRLGWFGRLPGDIAIEREGFRLYFPITTLILVNALIWIAVRLISWIRGGGSS